MAKRGLDVPPGFVITTEVCQEFYRCGGSGTQEKAAGSDHSPKPHPKYGKGLPFPRPIPALSLPYPCQDIVYRPIPGQLTFIHHPSSAFLIHSDNQPAGCPLFLVMTLHPTVHSYDLAPCCTYHTQVLSSPLASWRGYVAP